MTEPRQECPWCDGRGWYEVQETDMKPDGTLEPVLAQEQCPCCIMSDAEFQEKAEPKP